MEYIFWTAAGYLSGSVLYAYLLPKLIHHVDVRKLSSDGNPGTANAFRYGSFTAGCLVIFCELLKGCVPVAAALHFVDRRHPLFLLVMASPVIGHAFPVFQGGKGGKAIAVSFGVTIGLYPEVLPLCLMIFFYLLFSLVFVIRPHLLRSIATFLIVGILGCLFLENRVEAAGLILIAFVVIVKHMENFKGEAMEISLFGRKIL